MEKDNLIAIGKESELMENESKHMDISKPFPGKPEFSVDRSILKSMKEKIRKAAEGGKCDKGLIAKTDHAIDMLNGIVYNKRFLKIPLNLIYVNEAGTTELVSLFQMIEEGNKPIITKNRNTGESCVIRRPFIPNFKIHGDIWMMLGTGVLKVDTGGYVSLTKLVKNEESFEKRKTILKTIEKKTGNKHGCVINLQELLEVFSEAAAKGEEKNIGHIIEQLFNSKRQ